MNGIPFSQMAGTSPSPEEAVKFVQMECLSSEHGLYMHVIGSITLEATPPFELTTSTSSSRIQGSNRL